MINLLIVPWSAVLHSMRRILFSKAGSPLKPVYFSLLIWEKGFRNFFVTRKRRWNSFFSGQNKFCKQKRNRQLHSLDDLVWAGYFTSIQLKNVRTAIFMFCRTNIFWNKGIIETCAINSFTSYHLAKIQSKNAPYILQQRISMQFAIIKIISLHGTLSSLWRLKGKK